MGEFKNLLGSLQQLEYEDSQRLQDVVNSLGGLGITSGVPDSLNKLVSYCN